MNNNIFETFFEKYMSLESEDEKLNFQKDFMLSLSFKDLKAWTDCLSDSIDAQMDKNIKRGLTEEDKEFYRRHFARFDALIEQINHKKAA